jgi:hypothetical protein
MATYNSIILERHLKIQKELEANETVTPGMLVERVSGDKFQKHSVAGGPAVPMFVKENALLGNEISDDYSSGDKAQVCYFTTGDEVYTFIAGGENVSEGDYLESDGAGHLQVAGANSADSVGVSEYPNSIVAVALEAVDATDSSNVAERIQVEIL